MITLAAASTLRGLSGTATAITCSVFGDEIASGTDAFKKLFQGQLATSVATLYTVPGSTQALIKTIILDNTTGSPATATLYVDGTAAANRICSFTIPAGGEAVWAADGWKVLDANGAVATTSSGGSGITALTGDVTASGSGSVAATLATVNSNVGSFGTATQVGTHTVNGKGLITAASNTAIQIARTQVDDMATGSNPAFPLGTGAWTTYTPTLTQSATVTKTLQYASYNRTGRIITGSVSLTVTGAGTAANTVLIGLPVAAASSATLVIGSAFLYDDSAGALLSGALVINTTTTARISPPGTSGVGYLGTSVFTAGLASPDQVSYFFCYEAAT